jgi:hypothetical protein
MTTDKPSQNEDEYFARQDAELIKKQRAERQKAEAAAERRSHYMKCPKCGSNLVAVDVGGVQIDRCPDCNGVWLDNGELDILKQHHDPTFVGRVFKDLFKSLRKK